MVDEVLALTFVGGKRLQHTIAATAGNVVYNASPATGKRWLILRGVITLVTDVTVANRYVMFQITDGSNVIEELGRNTNAFVASSTYSVYMGEINMSDAWTYLGNAYLGITPILIEEADQFRITITGGVAGDSFSGFLVVREL